MPKTKPTLLILDDDVDLKQLISDYFKPRGYEIECRDDAGAVLAELQNASNPNLVFDVILSDLRMPKMDGMEFIAKMKKLAPKVPILLMTAHGNVDVSLKAIAEGAFDFVVKPIHFAQLTVSIERALRLRQVEFENLALRTVVKEGHSSNGVIAKSTAMKAVMDLVKRVAPSNATVLITGESGSGKEVIARAIYKGSQRKAQPFVAINCSAIPENLLEAELFGYAKGAFTGAVEKKIGLFEEADGGVLFLDEIGDLSLALQAKFLRVLQERKIRRVGENILRPVDVRILAATHKELKQEVQEGRFREDLYFRLSVIPIHVPPLRERPEDILPLAEYFLSRFALENDSHAREFSKPALDHLLRLPWRGNVRELENAIERAVVLTEDREIKVKDLPSNEHAPFDHHTRPAARVQEPNASTENAVDIFTPFFSYQLAVENLPSLDQLLLEYIKLVLGRVGGVKERTAKILKIDRKTLYRRIQELEMKQKFLAPPSPTPSSPPPLSEAAQRTLYSGATLAPQ